MDLPFLKLQSDHNDAEELDEYLLADRTIVPAAFGDDNGFDGDFGGDHGGFGDAGFDAATGADFGKGGENWADGSIIGDNDSQGFEALKDIKGPPGRFVMALSGQEGENILSYFDERGGKNWAGPEHWRIQRIKKGFPLHNERC